jgi:hypothetical protein
MAEPGYFCIVTAHNASGSAEEQSNDLLAVPGRPNNTVPPLITGVTKYNQILNCTTGTWVGNAPITYSFQWKRLPNTNIIGANSQNYTLTAADVGLSIRCTVSAANAIGSSSYDSNTVGAITRIPENQTAPVVTGTTWVGFALSCSTGTWLASPAPTFAFQWKRNGTVPISTEKDYIITPADVGSTIVCTVTATNNAGATPADSNTTAAVTTGPGWTPGALPGLVSWYKADAEIYSDIGGATPSTDGQPARRWGDQSNSNDDLTYPDIYMNWNANGWASGKPAVMLNGGIFKTADNAVSLSGNKVSFFMVIKKTVPNPPDNFDTRFMSFVATGDGTDYSTVGSFTALSTLGGYNTPHLPPFRIQAVRNNSYDLSYGFIDPDVKYRLGSIFDGNFHTLYINNVAYSPGNCQGNFATGTLYIPNQPGIGQSLTGVCAEIVMTNTALTPTERTQLDNYFTSTSRWGPF